MANELKIRIKTDSKGIEQHLDSITIEAAEALKIFIDSLMTLAKLYDNSSDFKISLTKGSVETNLIPAYNSGLEFMQDMKDIVNGDLKDTAKIKAFKTIQDKIKLNGLDYEVFWKVNESTNDLTHVFKGKNFSYKRNTDDYIHETVFLNGRFYAAGGKSVSNIHIDNGAEEYTIGCSEDEVVRMNEYFYKQVSLSVIKSSKPEGKPRYKLIDYYSSIKEQEELKQFYNSIIKDRELGKFDIIHNKLQELIADVNINAIKHIINLFNNSYTERGIIRTILLTLKPFMNSKALANLVPVYEDLSSVLRKGSLNNKI